MSRRVAIIFSLFAAIMLSACGARDDAADAVGSGVASMVVRDAAGRELERSSWAGAPDAVQLKIAQADAWLMQLRARRPGTGLTVTLEGGAVSRSYTLDASLRGSLFRLDDDMKSDRF